MLEELKTIDEECKIECDKIVECIHGAEYHSDVFDQPFVFDTLADRPQKLWGRRGVYVFMIKKEVPLTTEQVRTWNKIIGAGFTNWRQGSLKEGDCLYVGSSTTSLFSRIRQHFIADGEQAALRLSDPRRSVVLDSVRVYAFPAKKIYNKHYRLLVTTVESFLHEALRPKAGGSKV